MYVGPADVQVKDCYVTRISGDIKVDMRNGMTEGKNEVPESAGAPIMPHSEGQNVRYRAPALEKGLDILELLAKEGRPLTNTMMSEKLGRSLSELFRMVQVLEYRGFIEQAEDGRGYLPTDKLLLLGMERAPHKSLLEYALPVMRELSVAIGQSCHLAVRSGNEIVVVARVESAEQIGFTVRIGYRKAFISTASGAVLYAFMDQKDQNRWLSLLPDDVPGTEIENFKARAENIRINGYDKRKSGYTAGITDICAPVLRGTAAAVALTVPFAHITSPVAAIEDAIKRLRAAAAEISASLLIADHRI